MTIRTPLRTITAMGGALLLMLLTGPDAGAVEPAPDDVRPVLQGEEISGGGNLGDAVELSSGTQYLDEFSAGTLHYRIPREVDHSTIHIGVTTLGQDGEGDSVRVETGTWEGDLCSSDTISSSAAGFRDHLRTTHVAAGPPLDGGADGACGSSEEIVLTIELTMDPEDSRSVGQPVEILVHEEPRPVRLGTLPPSDEDFDGGEWQDIGRNVAGALEVTPSRSFGGAPELEPGSTYDVTIHPGETQIFRVPLDWGQRLQAEAYFPEPDEALADQLSGMGSVALMAANPLRAGLDHDSGAPSMSSSSQHRVSTGPIRWFNRESSHAMLAGDHFLVVTADQHDSGADISMLYRLTLDTFGEAGDGAPEYPEGHEDAWPVFEGGEVTADRSGADALSRISALGDSSAVVAALATVGLLLLGTGIVVLVRVIGDPRPLPESAPQTVVPHSPGPHPPGPKPPGPQPPRGQNPSAGPPPQAGGPAPWGHGAQHR
ncbi:hypothetical protein [Nesterenkonia xinjiangensis]|uniref:Uncharacterized protein n=1 Tax=Nesterenkonia xinjiangensis TaxID=225327 RepID=A0A7Z0K975_9MICC|nr:hypothetical protein [Nesterenkonia xinjiangensis]NYJ76925.1 hypothetical protein [Nesterenkonia xinjiangensis]